MAEQEIARRYRLYNRYVFTGRLEMSTALHIGGGKATLSYSDSPVVLTPEEQPFIPGSSFKGALRSTVEKIVPSLGAALSSCGLIEQEGEQYDKALCPTSQQKQIASKKRDLRNPRKADEFLDQVRSSLCNTCQLFGSPFAAARVNVDDLYLIEDTWAGVVQVRDGVAINRDSESAKKGLKYDFEVVPPTTVFNLRITIENATGEDLQLISLGLSEFMHGFGGIGGKRSRGLGACLLDNLNVAFLDLDEKVEKEERQRRLQNYLLLGEKGLTVVPYQTFLDNNINAIFKKSLSAQ